MPLSNSELRLIASDPELVGKLSEEERQRIKGLSAPKQAMGVDSALRLANSLAEQEKAKTATATAEKPAVEGKPKEGEAVKQIDAAKGVFGYLKSAAEAPSALIVGALERLRETDLTDLAGGVETARALATPGTPESFALMKAMVPMTPEAESLGRGLVQGALDELDRAKRFLADPAKVAREEPGGVVMLGLDVAGGAGLVSSVVRRGTTKALLKGVATEAQAVNKNALNYMDELERAGVAITHDEALRATTASDVFGVVPGGPGTILEPAPRPHGQVARWNRQFPGEEAKGQMAFDEFRRANNLIAYGDRVIALRNRAFFDQTPTKQLLAKFGVGQSLKPQDLTDLTGVLRGVTLDETGKLRFGAIARAGNQPLPKNMAERMKLLDTQPPGTVLPDGRIVGEVLTHSPDERALYRVISPEQGKRFHDEFVARGPRQKEVLEQMLATKEDSVVVAGGQRLPAMARSVLKEQYGIVGLTTEEAAHASALAREAMPGVTGPAPLEFNWVPESLNSKPNLMSGFRNGLNQVTAQSRRFKSGAAFEKAFQTGEDIDFAAALTKTHTDLFAEGIRNDAASSILSIAAVPLKAGDTIPTGWRLFNTGMYGDSATFRKFIGKKRESFKQMGIDVDAMVDESFKVSGRAYIIPSKVGDDLGVWFNPKALDANPKYRELAAGFDRAAGEIIAIPQTFWLTRPATAVRNFTAQSLTMTPKIMRDFYRGMIQSALPSMRFQEVPFQDFFSDFIGIGKAHKSAVAGSAIPEELLGTTFAAQLEMGRPSTVGGKMLRATGFNYADVSSKRALSEAVIDATGKNSYAVLNRKGLTKGMTQVDFLKRWRSNLPKSVESLMWREMDTFAYDYSNVPATIEKLKQSHTMRSLLPYPTYAYKLLANTYTELFSYKNLTTMVSASSSQAEKVNAMANMMAGATIMGLAFEMVDEGGELVGEMKDSIYKGLAARAEHESGRKIKESDLPVDVERFGRAKVPMSSDWKKRMELAETEGLWVRLYDMPFIGEAMAAKAIYGGRYTVRQYLNDRITLGPLHNAVAIAAGLSNRYNKHLTEGARAGDLASEMLPFSNELQLARKLTDTTKREAGSESKAAFRNFMEGFADNYPILSTLLPERLRTSDLSIPKYSRPQTLGSYLMLNSRVVDEDIRDAEIAAAGLALLEDTRDEVKRDAIRQEVKKIVDAMGQTVPGQVKKAVELSEGELATKTEQTINSIYITRAHRDGGLEAALKVTMERLKNVDESVPAAGRPSLARSAKELLERLELQSKNMTMQVLQDAPARSRVAGLEQLQQAEPGNEMLKFLPGQAP